MFTLDLTKPFGDLIKSLIPGDALPLTIPAIALSSHRMKRPIGVLAGGDGRVRSLNTKRALRSGMIGITRDPDNSTVV